MNLTRARVAFRERPLLDVLDLALRFSAVHAKSYLRLSVAVLVPALAVCSALTVAGGWWLGWTAAIIMTPFAQTPFLVLASKLVFADETEILLALRTAVGALPRMGAIALLRLLGCVLSLVLMGLPWLWVGTVTLFAPEVAILENASVGSSLARAMRIANAHLGAALLAMVVLLVGPLASALFADFAGDELLRLLQIKPPAPLIHEGGSYFGFAGWWASIPFVATARFFVYLDIRTRAEGWDIQTRFAAIAARYAGAGGP